MAESLEAQLTRVQAAIAAIEEGAQEYSIGTRKFVRADLTVLYAREKELRGRIAGDTYGTRAYAQWPGR